MAALTSTPETIHALLANGPEAFNQPSFLYEQAVNEGIVDSSSAGSVVASLARGRKADKAELDTLRQRWALFELALEYGLSSMLCEYISAREPPSPENEEAGFYLSDPRTVQNWAWSTAQQSISEGLRLVDEGLAPIVGGDRNSARKRSQSSKTDTTSAEEVGQQLERLDRRLRALLCVFSSLLARLQEGKGTHSSEMVEEEQDEFDLDAADAASRAMRDGMMEEVTELTVTGEHHLLHKMETLEHFSIHLRLCAWIARQGLCFPAVGLRRLFTERKQQRALQAQRYKAYWAPFGLTTNEAGGVQSELQHPPALLVEELLQTMLGEGRESSATSFPPDDALSLFHALAPPLHHQLDEDAACGREWAAVDPVHKLSITLYLALELGTQAEVHGLAQEGTPSCLKELLLRAEALCASLSACVNVPRSMSRAVLAMWLVDLSASVAAQRPKSESPPAVKLLLESAVSLLSSPSTGPQLEARLCLATLRALAESGAYTAALDLSGALGLTQAPALALVQEQHQKHQVPHVHQDSHAHTHSHAHPDQDQDTAQTHVATLLTVAAATLRAGLWQQAVSLYRLVCASPLANVAVAVNVAVTVPGELSAVRTGSMEVLGLTSWLRCFSHAPGLEAPTARSALLCLCVSWLEKEHRLGLLGSVSLDASGQDTLMRFLLLPRAGEVTREMSLRCVDVLIGYLLQQRQFVRAAIVDEVQREKIRMLAPLLLQEESFRVREQLIKTFRESLPDRARHSLSSEQHSQILREEVLSLLEATPREQRLTTLDARAGAAKGAENATKHKSAENSTADGDMMLDSDEGHTRVKNHTQFSKETSMDLDVVMEREEDSGVQDPAFAPTPARPSSSDRRPRTSLLPEQYPASELEERSPDRSFASSQLSRTYSPGMFSGRSPTAHAPRPATALVPVASPFSPAGMLHAEVDAWSGRRRQTHTLSPAGWSPMSPAQRATPGAPGVEEAWGSPVPRASPLPPTSLFLPAQPGGYEDHMSGEGSSVPQLNSDGSASSAAQLGGSNAYRASAFLPPRPGRRSVLRTPPVRPQYAKGIARQSLGAGILQSPSTEREQSYPRAPDSATTMLPTPTLLAGPSDAGSGASHLMSTEDDSRAQTLLSAGLPPPQGPEVDSQSASRESPFSFMPSATTSTSSVPQALPAGSNAGRARRSRGMSGLGKLKSPPPTALK